MSSSFLESKHLFFREIFENTDICEWAPAPHVRWYSHSLDGCIIQWHIATYRELILFTSQNSLMWILQWVELVTISNPNKFCASTGNRTLASCIPGEHHITSPSRQLTTITFIPAKEKACPHVSSPEITLATKCYSGSNKVSQIPGKHHTTKACNM